jgi:hypothetical protein
MLTRPVGAHIHPSPPGGGALKIGGSDFDAPWQPYSPPHIRYTAQSHLQVLNTLSTNKPMPNHQRSLYFVPPSLFHATQELVPSPPVLPPPQSRVRHVVKVNPAPPRLHKSPWPPVHVGQLGRTHLPPDRCRHFLLTHFLPRCTPASEQSIASLQRRI